MVLGLQKGMLIARWRFQDASVVCLCSLVLERYIEALQICDFYGPSSGCPNDFRLLENNCFFIFLESSLWIGLNSSSLLNIFIRFVVIFFEFITCCMVIFCLGSMLRIVLKQNRAVTILTRQLRFNHSVSHKPYEKSAVLIMAVVSGLLVLCNVPYLRCGFLKIFNFIHNCFDLRYKIPVLVLNSAVIPFAYAAFERDLKNEFKRLICTVTSTKHEQRKTHKNIYIAVARTSLF